jgi:thiol:disulfide interchange protein
MMLSTQVFMAIELTTGLMVIIAGTFVLVAAAAYVVFRMLRKSVRMAIRLAFVAAVILVIGVGGVSLWWFGTGTSQSGKPKPPASKKK